MSVLVIAEQRDGALNRASWEAVAAAQAIGGPIKIVLPGTDVQAAAKELSAADVAEVLALEHAALGTYTPDGFVQALAALVGSENPGHVICAHTYQARDFIPKLAARLDRALVTDCTAVKAGGGTVFRQRIRLAIDDHTMGEMLVAIHEGARGPRA